MNNYTAQNHISHNPETLEPEQKYPIHSKEFRIQNYGDTYFYPHNRLTAGLKEVIIFRENQKKYDIPNGSVWIYDKNQAYKPEILKEDVGCGMTAYIIPSIDYTLGTAKEIVQMLAEEKIKIGRGNHFLDFTGSHPLTGEGNMIILHSDFHFDNTVPDSYKKAQDMTKSSQELRMMTIEKIMRKIGIKGSFYKNWTHNTVEISDTQAIYRKGAISLKETQLEGLLALNPYDGFYSYIDDAKTYKGYMQHGAGKKIAGNMPANESVTIELGNVKGILVDKTRKPENLYEHYQKVDRFMESFSLGQRALGGIRPKLVINTD